jgi:transcriptional regulator with XRE-family HTH domain
MDVLAGNTLRSYRRAAGMSQQQLARRLGVGQSIVSHWEKGTREPSAETMGHIEEVLGLPRGVLGDLAAPPLSTSQVAVADAVAADTDLDDETRDLLVRIHRVFVTRKVLQ